MRLLHEIAIFQTVKSKVIISLFETVRLSVLISLRNLYNSLFDFFNERSFFISLMNTKSGIFTRGFATRENTAFVVHSVK